MLWPAMMPEIDEMLTIEPPSPVAFTVFAISGMDMLAAEEHAVEIDGMHVPPFLQRDLLEDPS